VVFFCGCGLVWVGGGGGGGARYVASLHACAHIPGDPERTPPNAMPCRYCRSLYCLQVMSRFNTMAKRSQSMRYAAIDLEEEGGDGAIIRPSASAPVASLGRPPRLTGVGGRPAAFGGRKGGGVGGTEADRLARRVAELEREVEMLKARKVSVAEGDAAVQG
jgi:hypothetical protein